MGDATAVRHGRLILVPAVITLAVTLLRLTGELLGWSSVLFNRDAGGGGALVGIVWLVPVFGIYFALALARAGERPGKMLRALGLVLLALVLMPVVGAVATAAGVDPLGLGMLVLAAVAAVGTVLLTFSAWPALTRVLVVYGLAARIPVAIIMLLAILGSWGTHYDAPPEGFPEMAPLALWFWVGLIPQMLIWIAFTVVVGVLCGLVAVALVHRGRKAEAA